MFKEFAREGTIDVQRFWLRRWLRTLPAYYAVLVLSIAQRLLAKDNVEFPYSYFVFLQNYEHPLYFFSISWSLCLEEHFYLFVAPTLLLLFTRLRAKVGLSVLLALLVMPLVFRELGWYGTLHETIVVLALSCAASEVLYRVVEKSTMDAREEFAISKSKG